MTAASRQYISEPSEIALSQTAFLSSDLTIKQPSLGQSKQRTDLYLYFIRGSADGLTVEVPFCIRAPA